MIRSRTRHIDSHMNTQTPQHKLKNRNRDDVVVRRKSFPLVTLSNFNQDHYKLFRNFMQSLKRN